MSAGPVSLFITCFNDTLFPGTGRATVELLEHLGCTVEFRAEQTCCGQMHRNSGYLDEAEALTERFRRVFAGAGAIVAPSASCAGHVRAQAPDLPVFELTEYLTDVLGVEDVGARFPHRVAYHPTCHSLRELGLGDRPQRLLEAVRDLELLPLEDADQCCGFGGTFAVKNADTSTAMMDDKLDRIERSGAEVLTSADNSCLMQLDGGLRRRGSSVRVMHLAEILAAR
jgi:L-lactate dehydrogenase complex protein LldE